MSKDTAQFLATYQLMLLIADQLHVNNQLLQGGKEMTANEAIRSHDKALVALNDQFNKLKEDMD